MKIDLKNVSLRVSILKFIPRQPRTFLLNRNASCLDASFVFIQLRKARGTCGECAGQNSSNVESLIEVERRGVSIFLSSIYIFSEM